MPLNNLQLELQSPDQVRSIVKPYYSHWAPYTSNKNNTFSNKIMLETNSFYLDKTSGGEWKLTVTSACRIDSDAMNRFKVRIYGYTN
jgi:subtilisin-like proprotein convertase family protein